MVAIYKPNKERSIELTDEDMSKLVGYVRLLDEVNKKNQTTKQNLCDEDHSS
jgi:hypothetical protein